MILRPKKITLLDKESINSLVTELIKHRKVTITNLCVLELVTNDVGEYYNVATRTKKITPRFRVNIKKARYLKDEIARQTAKNPI